MDERTLASLALIVHDPELYRSLQEYFEYHADKYQHKLVHEESETNMLRLQGSLRELSRLKSMKEEVEGAVNDRKRNNKYA